MRLLILIMTLSIILSSYVYATMNQELSACGENIRCKFRVASKYGDAGACNSLPDSLKDDCGEYVVKTGGSEKAKYSGFVLTGILLVIMVFVTSIIYLFVQHYYRESFIKSHKSLLNYINGCFEKGMDELQIKSELKKVGWAEKVIQKAIINSKFFRKGNFHA
ncbi:MAG: hypothetical protein KKF89_03320 [Nanoarchaeota archaeon]|nr:hypothetical protein [Nanoarchaeota archaeon]MBU1854726.1 hypothetical protein [Nanoarchaeota archaeon]